MSEEILFANEQPDAASEHTDMWKLLIVDDDESIHDITKLALKNLKFKGKRIEFSSAYSAKESIELLAKDEKFSIVLLDIGMETKDAGLEVAQFIRKDLHDNLTRIIIRTGQPGDTPEHQIIENYDINDFKSKTELTIEKLFISIRTAIAQYNQINELEILNKGLEKKIESALKIQKEQQEALFAQCRSMQMTELLNMLAHQWRQPLSRISAVTSQLKLAIALEEVDLNLFDTQVGGIEKYIHDLSKTIDEFRSVYEPSDLSANTPICTMLEKSAAIIKSISKNINIEIRCDDEEVKFYSSNYLHQVIINMLKNSHEEILRKNIQDPIIKISVSKENEYIHIEIEDNACGVDVEIIEKIFDPYFTTKENRNGHGLGLYMSKNIIEQQYNGKLSVTNKANGACFKITLKNK